LKHPALASLLLLVALDAHAAGVGLRWNSCLGTSNRNFACDRSTGSEVLVGTFSSPATITMSGLEVYFTINTVDDQLPAWWKVIEAGSCRSTSLSVTVDVSAETECSDPWLGQGSGFLVMYRGEIPTIIAAAPKEAQQTISAGVTYAAFRLTINHARSNGPAACEGCEKPACISIDRMLLTTANKKDVELTEGLPGMGGAANVAKWQGGTPECGAGAAKPSTWSELKRRFK